MTVMPDGRARVKLQTGQLCLFAWADAHYLAWPIDEHLAPMGELLVRTQRTTGWSLAYARAVIEANGGRLYDW